MDSEIFHFGLILKYRKHSYKLTRETYVEIPDRSATPCAAYKSALINNDESTIKSYAQIYADREGRIYADEYREKRLAEVMENFDLNMEFYQKLDYSEFENEITQFLQNTEFKEIQNLSQYTCAGFYVLILDEYKQLYVGRTEGRKNIMLRIKEHWAGKKMKHLDRLMCTKNVKTSRLSIDSFRALDTTRILVYKTEDTSDEKEENFINMFSDKFICNRNKGGNMEFGEISVAANMKIRNLSK